LNGFDIIYVINQNQFIMKNQTTTTARGRKNPRAKSVYQTTAGGRKLKKYSSISEAGQVTGTDPSSISKAMRGILKSAGGFYWKTV
jgi:hypothetical protein